MVCCDPPGSFCLFILNISSLVGDKVCPNETATCNDQIIFALSIKSGETSNVEVQWKFFFYCLHLSNKLFKNHFKCLFFSFCK